MTSTASGFVYIIGELDHAGTPTDLYKIGIVRDSETNRTVEDRLADHQTGNPRELYVAHSEPSHLVERVETLIHGEFATSRVGGEWLHLPHEALSQLIRTLRTHVAAARVHAPFATHARQLASEVSDGATIEPTEIDLNHHFEQHKVRSQLSACATAMTHLTTELVEAQHIQNPDRPWVLIENRSGRPTFDKRAFESANPDLYATYLRPQTKMSKTFRLTKASNTGLTIDDIDKPFAALCARSTQMSSGSHDGEALHRQYLKVLSQHTILKWQNEQLDARIRVACGTNEAINGLCTWRRHLVTENVLDLEALRRDQPDLYREFLTTSKPTTAHNPRKDLGYRT